MAHFYGDMGGSRGPTTRCGTKSSGIYCHVRGWDVGVHASMDYGPDGKDCARISITGGSNHRRAAVGLQLSAFELERILCGEARLSLIPVTAPDPDRVEIITKVTGKELTWKDHVDMIEPRGSGKAGDGHGETE